MKKIFILFLSLLVVFSVSSCYKSDSLDFMQGQYIMKAESESEFSFDGLILYDASIVLFEIDKESYDNRNKQNVLKNRYSEKYYSVKLRMKIGNIEYEDITTYEYDGSSYYSNCYFLGIKLNINDKEYEWELRLDLYNRPWEYQEQDKGNCIYCNIYSASSKGSIQLVFDPHFFDE